MQAEAAGYWRALTLAPVLPPTVTNVPIPDAIFLPIACDFDIVVRGLCKQAAHGLSFTGEYLIDKQDSQRSRSYPRKSRRYSFRVSLGNR